MTTSRRFTIAIFAAASIVLSWATPALGSVHTWIGPTNGLWSNAANWSGGKPTSGESGGTIVQFGSGIVGQFGPCSSGPPFVGGGLAGELLERPLERRFG